MKGAAMLAYDYPILGLFWTMLIFFSWLAWIMLVFRVIVDIVVGDMGGLSKAIWAMFVIVVPWLGVLTYLVVNGDAMTERTVAAAERHEAEIRTSLPSVAGNGDTADEIAKFSELHAAGVLTDAEFARQQAKLTGGQPRAHGENVVGAVLDVPGDDQGQAASVRGDAVATDGVDSERLMRIYLEEVVVKGRLELIDELAHPDMVDEANQAFGGPAGRPGLVAHVQGFNRNIENLDLTVERIVANDDSVMAWWSFSGVHAGPWLGRPPTGQPIEVTVFSFFDLLDGRISRYRLWLHAGFDEPVVFDTSRPGT